MDSSAEVHDVAGAPWGIEAMARTVGHLCWFDRRTSEVLAAWSRSTADQAAAVAFAEQARHRAWHADLWFERLPELVELPAEPLVVPSSPALVELAVALEALGGPAAPGPTDGPEPSGGGADGSGDGPADAGPRLAVLGRVLLPHQVRAVGRVAGRCRPAADRALARTAALVRRDLLEHWEVLAGLLDDRLAGGTPGGSDQATALPAVLARHQAHLEGLLVASGGIVALR